MSSRIHLLCVGVNKYPNMSSGYQLDYCAKDANLIFSSYKHYHSGINKILCDEQATKENILCALTDLSGTDVREEDYVIIFFAGHGITIDDENPRADNSFICPHNFNPSYAKETGIKLSELKQSVELIRSKHKLLILDACKSGSALRRDLSKFKLRSFSKRELIRLVAPGSGSAIATGCDSKEYSHENGVVEHGLFTHSLVKVLKGSSEDYVPFKKVSEETTKLVIDLTNGSQTPQFQSNSEDFTVPKIPEEGKRFPSKLDLKVEKLPDPSFQGPELEGFESEILSLIEENKLIELDINIKDRISKAYKEIKDLIKNFKGDPSSFLGCFEACRDKITPLRVIFQCLARYNKTSLIKENFRFLLLFEEITIGNGYTTILNIPYILISEIIFSTLMEVNCEDEDISFIFHPSKYYNTYQMVPLIYNAKIWYLKSLGEEPKKLFEFLFPGTTKEEPLTKLKQQQLAEVIFLIDSVSEKDERYRSFPAYYFLEFDSYLLLYSLEQRKYDSFIEKNFGLNLNDFLELAIKRQEKISAWRGVEFRHWHSNLHKSLIELKKKITGLNQ